MDKLSYALGLSMGQNFKHSGVKELNADDFASALKAVYSGAKPEFSYEEAQKVVNEFFTQLQAEQMRANKELGKKFLEENAKQEGVKVTASGLQYKVIKAGTGMPPKATDKVTVHYTGRLIDGTVFDSSVERGEPATFGVNQVIPGWVEALQMMNEGAEWQLYIPSELAYGSQGAGQMILPDSTLIFDVKLIKVERSSGLIL
ncbi:MAG: FKBP-type peptidyl-prolyl cis-trans isomerase [Muribaculaceae bacterium]|nr:FKBP-type peptidyl-prolyl cis-trans isomerase [Muribaculaceae bacterium]